MVCGRVFLGSVHRQLNFVAGLSEHRAAVYVSLPRGKDGGSYLAFHFFADANSMGEGNATI